MRISINVKALGAFWNLGAVALITATIFFTACKQTGNTGGESTPKHAVTFSVEGSGGTLKAKAEGLPETEASPITIEQGKVITFKAEAKAGYRVKGWTLDGKPITEAGTNTEYKLTVTKVVTVKVSFEAIPPTKYTVTLTQTANGTVTPSSAIPQDGVDKDTVITFTATAESGYRVNTWAVTPSEAIQSGGKKGETTATLKITANTTVSVSFEAIPPTKYTVTLTQTEHGTVTSSPEIPADKLMPKDTVITFTATANEGYKIGKWTVTGSTLEAGTGAEGSETAKVKITADTSVTVSFELIPQAILTLDAGKKDIKVKAKTADGSAIEVKGCNETTLASNTETTLNATGTKVILKGNITELSCGGNKLTSLNVQGLTSLQTLKCYENQLTELNVQGLTSLQGLYCYKNQLTALNVQGLTNLQELYCNTNQIPELNVQNLTKLQKLNCSRNQLTALDASGCTALQKLDCEVNQLTALNVSDCTALQELICNSNELSTLDVSGLTKLQKLTCGGNKLTALKVQGLTALQGLWCPGNQLTELNVQGCTALQELYCSYNQLTSLDVQGLTALKDIRCHNNQLTSLDVQGLTALKDIRCYSNKLTELNVQDCAALQKLVCYSNQLNAQAMTKLLNALPAREKNDVAKAILYAEETGKTEEGNCKDFTQPEDLKKALEGAKSRNWTLAKFNTSENSWVEI